MLQSCDDAAAAVLLGCKDALIDASLTKQTTVGRASVPRCLGAQIPATCDARITFSRHYQPRVQLFIRTANVIFRQYILVIDISTISNIYTSGRYNFTTLPTWRGGQLCWVLSVPMSRLSSDIGSDQPPPTLPHAFIAAGNSANLIGVFKNYLLSYY